MREILRVNMTDLSTSWEPVPEGWALVRRSCPDRRDHLQRGARRRRSARPGQRTRLRPRHARRHDRPERRSPVRRRQEPADRRHQGVELRRPGRALARPARHRGGRRRRASPPTRTPATRSSIEADRSVKLERVDAWAGLGNYEVADAIAATAPRGRPLRDDHQRPRRRGARAGRRHRRLRPQGLSRTASPAAAVSARSWAARASRPSSSPTRARASSSTPTRRPSSPPPRSSRRRSRSTASPAPVCRCTAPTCSRTS